MFVPCYNETQLYLPPRPFRYCIVLTVLSHAAVSCGTAVCSSASQSTWQKYVHGQKGLVNELYRTELLSWLKHYNDVIMSAMASQIISLTIAYSTVHSGLDQRKHQSSASLAFVRGIHQWPVNFPHRWPVSRKMFPFDGFIICLRGHSDTWFVAQLFALAHLSQHDSNMYMTQTGQVNDLYRTELLSRLKDNNPRDKTIFRIIINSKWMKN